jgi:hypothetical protein
MPRWDFVSLDAWHPKYLQGDSTGGDFMTNIKGAAQGRGIDWPKIGIWFAVPIATWSGIIASLWWTL